MGPTKQHQRQAYRAYDLGRAVFHQVARLRRVRLFVLLVLLLFFLDLVSIARTRNTLHSSSRQTSNTYPRIQERIYIASLHWNDEVLLRNHWIPSLVNLVSHIPPENVYISILESGSWDDTKGALLELDAQLEKLGIERSIVLGNRTHVDAINEGLEAAADGLVWTPSGKQELRRIPFLAKERNRAMDQLGELAVRENGPKRRFDKVLWLNDVIFTVRRILNSHQV